MYTCTVYTCTPRVSAVSLVAVVAVLRQVHDAVVVVVALGTVHDDLLRVPMPHYNALQPQHESHDSVPIYSLVPLKLNKTFSVKAENSCQRSV